MARVEKTVFISYRRKDISWALAVYQDLTHQGYDVFFDYTSLPSGDFEQIIISNIKARAHFVLILTPTTLDRCSEPGDWLRREIETAIDEKRNIIPLFFNGFSFGSDKVSVNLTGKLKKVSQYNGMNVHQDYFSEAMTRLRTKFLSIPLNAVLHPVSDEVQEVVLEEQHAANEAAKKLNARVKRDAAGARKKKQKEFIERISKLISSNIRRFSIGGIILIGIIGTLLAGNYLINNFPASETPEITHTPTEEITVTSTFAPTPTATKPLAISTTTRFDIGSTTLGKDGMTLAFVPSGEFLMGNQNSPNSDAPPHQVFLDSYWIDQTEVTNAMYAKCVQEGICTFPSSLSSLTQDTYYGNSQFDNYPVIYVNWQQASSYCTWAERRLPTEAEWEKAARGPDGLYYPWGDNGPSANLLNYLNSVFDTTIVGSYPAGASVYGALDMAGNVWELVNDWYSKEYYYNSPAVNPRGPSSGEYKVLRGGSFHFDNESWETYYRNWAGPNYTNNKSGFRCAMDGDQ